MFFTVLTGCKRTKIMKVGIGDNQGVGLRKFLGDHISITSCPPYGEGLVHIGIYHVVGNVWLDKSILIIRNCESTVSRSFPLDLVTEDTLRDAKWQWRHCRFAHSVLNLFFYPPCMSWLNVTLIHFRVWLALWTKFNKYAGHSDYKSNSFRIFRNLAKGAILSSVCFPWLEEEWRKVKLWMWQRKYANFTHRRGGCADISDWEKSQ